MKINKFDQDINFLNLDTISRWNEKSIIYLKNGRLKTAGLWSFKGFLYRHSSLARYIINIQIKSTIDKLDILITRNPPSNLLKVRKKIDRIINTILTPNNEPDTALDQETLDQENLKTLTDGSSGDKFCVKKGRLQKVPFWTRIAFVTFGISDVNKQLVKQLVSYLTKKECTKAGVSREGDEKLQKLFIEKLSYLSEELFDRSTIHESSQTVIASEELSPPSLELPTPILRTIDDEIAVMEGTRREAKEAIDRLKSDIDRSDDTSAIPRLKKTLEEREQELQLLDVQLQQAEDYKKLHTEANLAEKLGIRAKKGDGCALSFIRRGLDGRPLMIFKPYKYDSIGPNPPMLVHKVRNFFGRNFSKELGGDPLFYRHIGNNTHHAETLNYLVAAGIGRPKLVPYTRISYMNKGRGIVVGSAQLFERGAANATKFFHMDKKYRFESPQFREEANAKLSDELFDEFAILDAITGHLDRHAENWMIIPDEKGNVKSLFAIDGGISFAPEHPDSAYPASNQKPYLWARYNFPHAERPFTVHGKALIWSIYQRKEALVAKVEKFYKDQGADPMISAKRIQCMRDRLEVLKYLADHGCPKKDILNYTSKQQINALLGRNESGDLSFLRHNLNRVRRVFRPIAAPAA